MRSDKLEFVSELDLVLYEHALPEFPITDYARTYPFSYAMEEAPDLARSVERHYPDPAHEVDLWAKGFVRIDAATDTNDLLTWMTRAIKTMFRYEARDEEGTQNPVETLRRGAGTCRDFALLMMEAVRSLGLAARFVSGYIYFAQRGRLGQYRRRRHACLDADLPAPAPAGCRSTRPTASWATATSSAWPEVPRPEAGDPAHGNLDRRRRRLSRHRHRRAGEPAEPVTAQVY